jgi:hypothetical protein
VKQYLAALATLALIGFASASALPASMTLMCGDDVIGVASYDGEELEVKLLEGFECTEAITVAEDDTVFVTVTLTDDGYDVSMTTDPTNPVVAIEVELDDTLDGPPVDAGRPDDAGKPDDVGPDLETLPQEALDGMEAAAQNREEAARKAEEAAGRPDEAGRPDFAGKPDGVGDGDNDLEDEEEIEEVEEEL